MNIKSLNKTPDTSSTLASLYPIAKFIYPYKAMACAAVFSLLITSMVTLSLGQGVKMVIDNGFIAGSSEQLRHTIAIMISLISLLAVGTFSRFYFMSWLGERVCADIRKTVFNRIIHLHPSYFEENKSGEIMSRLTTDTTLLQSIIGSSFSMALRSCLTLIGGVIMLFVSNPKLALIVIACVPVVLLPMLFFGRRVRKLASSSQHAIAGIGSFAGEAIQNIKVVQSYTHEEYEQDAFSNEVEAAFSVAKRRIRQRSALIGAVIFLVFSAISIMLWIGGIDVLNGTITGGELGAFIFYAIMVAMAVATLSEVYGELQRAAGSAERLMELLDVESLIQAPQQPLNTIKSTDIALSFNSVSFSYPSRPNQLAVKNINLAIRTGETIALVGPSGAGKTTIFELLLRFYDPQLGSIDYHGDNIKQLTPNLLRSKIGLVAQQPTLFSTDVLQNIRYGKPAATESEAIEAAKLAHAHSFIEQLPNGYYSHLGEQGVRLSGGQKQRVAIARAILKDPNILLLDEATSALDAQSEHHVQAALNELMTGRTTMIIAHRLATVLHADRIIVMDQGEVVAIGDHESLTKNSPLYRRLCELQFQHKV